MFETSNGVLFELRADGRPPLKVCTAFMIDSVLCDERRLLWALSLKAVNFEGARVEFQLDARDIYGKATSRCEKAFAFAGMEVGKLAGLVRYIQSNVPGTEPIIVSTLHDYDDGHNASSNRKLRQAHQDARRRALDPAA